MIYQKINNHKAFCQSNGYKFEVLVSELIKKQLFNCDIIHYYNKTYDLILHYRGYRYNIEVKSCRRFNQTNGYLSDGKFKIGFNQINNKKIHVFVFCIYFRKSKNFYFVLGKDLRKYFKFKNEITHYSLTVKQLFKYLKPKNKIIDIINQIKELN